MAIPIGGTPALANGPPPPGAAAAPAGFLSSTLAKLAVLFPEELQAEGQSPPSTSSVDAGDVIPFRKWMRYLGGGIFLLCVIEMIVGAVAFARNGNAGPGSCTYQGKGWCGYLIPMRVCGYTRERSGLSACVHMIYLLPSPVIFTELKQGGLSGGLAVHPLSPCLATVDGICC
jgi:hypothetical protein